MPYHLSKFTVIPTPECFRHCGGDSHLLEFYWPFDFGRYNLPAYHAQKFHMEPKHVGFQKESPFLGG